MRLLIVSNRLPITAVRTGKGTLSFQESAGGLVSGMSAYLDSLKTSSFCKGDYVWIGWPGVDVRGKARENLAAKARSEFHASPVFLTQAAMDRFYHGFCNRTVWPLFHYFPSYAAFDERLWKTYKEVNKIFADAVLREMKSGDVVWVHDYHLMLLPRLVRQQAPGAAIGFFLHIPFPDFEIFRVLPMAVRSELLTGVLGADLVGFHTFEYCQAFLRSVLRILGHEHNMGQIHLEDRVVRADTFPMGIDFDRYAQASRSPLATAEKKRLKKTLANYKVVCSIDRLDYTKGTINRLRGYELFLERNHRWHEKVVLAIVIVPSRIGVEQYQVMKKQTDELIGKINGRFGTINWTPILYQYRHLPLHPLVALYSLSDVALVTPLRDGMNLVAKEYLAARTDQTGVLILSEMAGAATELGEAVIINPNSIEEIADALKRALEMPRDTQIKSNTAMRTRLARWNVVRWADAFTERLFASKDEQKRFEARILGDDAKRELLAGLRGAAQACIFLDYDGTLVPFAERPELAAPTPRVLKILEKLAGLANVTTVLVSGRDRNAITAWFGHLDIGFVAEHGAWIMEKGAGDWRMLKPLPNEWKRQIAPIIERYNDLLPGSFLEEKEFSLVWHYRKADPELASLRSRELRDNLVQFTANIDVQILQGSMVIEVRNSGVNKGAACRHWLAAGKFDTILAVGDDWTDEDMFEVMPPTAYSMKVGMTSSRARFNLRGCSDVLELLEELLR